MTFLRKLTRSIFIPLIVGGVLTYLGFPLSISSFFGFVIFLWLNGPYYLRLACKTIPRDLAYFVKMVKAVLPAEKMIKKYPHLHDVFHLNVLKQPNKTAILFEERKLTFRELDLLSNRISNVLLSSTSIQRGDCIAVFMGNSPEYLAVYIALSKIGVVGALINCNLRGKSLAHCIEISKCCGIIFDDSLSEELSNVKGDLDSSNIQAMFSVGGDSSIADARNLDMEMESVASDSPPPLYNKSSKDLLCYIYTSGTTGLPKACNMNHDKAIQIGLVFPKIVGVLQEDIVYNVLPLYHTSGLLIGCGMMIAFGATVALRKKFSARNFSDDCFKYKCSVFVYIGEVCRYLVAQPAKPSDSKLRLRLVGNGLRGDVWKALQERFTIVSIMEFYGATEGNVFMANFVKAGAVGYRFLFFPFLQNFTLVKTDPESGEYLKNDRGFHIEAGINEPGELVAKISKDFPYIGYNNLAASNKKVLTDVFQKGDKYFSSGDVLRVNEEGFMFFCDRRGDTFRWKGENVSTTEVENVMARVYKFEKIVVYGVEIPGSEGRAGMAAIEGTADSVDLSEFAKQVLEALPKYAVPVFLRFTPEVDLTGTFKLKKVKLRSEGFNLKIVQDPIYVLDTSRKTYISLTEEIFEKIKEGSLKL